MFFSEPYIEEEKDYKSSITDPVKNLEFDLPEYQIDDYQPPPIPEYELPEYKEIWFSFFEYL